MGCPSLPTSVTPETSAMRRMKRSAAITMPTVTDTTMSNTIVSAKQETSTATSLRGAWRRRWKKCRHSPMFQATRMSRAAIDAMGR